MAQMIPGFILFFMVSKWILHRSGIARESLFQGPADGVPAAGIDGNLPTNASDSERFGVVTAAWVSRLPR